MSALPCRVRHALPQVTILDNLTHTRRQRIWVRTLYYEPLHSVANYRSRRFSGYHGNPSSQRLQGSFGRAFCKAGEYQNIRSFILARNIHAWNASKEG